MSRRLLPEGLPQKGLQFLPCKIQAVIKYFLLPTRRPAVCGRPFLLRYSQPLQPGTFLLRDYCYVPPCSHLAVLTVLRSTRLTTEDRGPSFLLLLLPKLGKNLEASWQVCSNVPKPSLPITLHASAQTLVPCSHCILLHKTPSRRKAVGFSAPRLSQSTPLLFLVSSQNAKAIAHGFDITKPQKDTHLNP